MSDFSKFGISQEDYIQLGIFRFIEGLIAPPIEMPGSTPFEEPCRQRKASSRGKRRKLR